MSLAVDSERRLRTNQVQECQSGIQQHAYLKRFRERELSLATIADRARTSTRTLSRRFKEQTGMTPLGWVLRARVRRAQALLESTTATIEEVAARVGFESAATLRVHFHQLVGVNPTMYRRTMGGGQAPFPNGEGSLSNRRNSHLQHPVPEMRRKRTIGR